MSEHPTNAPHGANSASELSYRQCWEYVYSAFGGEDRTPPAVDRCQQLVDAVRHAYRDGRAEGEKCAIGGEVVSERQTSAPISAPEHGDAGPAFPTDNAHQNSPSTWHFEGMSLKAYFMAHAPAEPQPWFRPVLAGPAVSHPPPVKDMTDAEQHEMDGWREGEYDVPMLKQPRVRAYALAWEEGRKARAIYSQELERQRYLQWPAAWADEQLAILKGRP